jgi:1,6-anhydro-N-acetylmuramate kinase
MNDVPDAQTVAHEAQLQDRAPERQIQTNQRLASKIAKKAATALRQPDAAFFCVCTGIGGHPAASATAIVARNGAGF